MPKVPMREIQVTGPLVLVFPNGYRMNVSVPQRSGRPPSPAVLHLIRAIEKDVKVGLARPRTHYMDVLRMAGYAGSDSGARQIVAREVQRRGGILLARQPSPALRLLRAQLKQDAEAGLLQDAATYADWLVALRAKPSLRQARRLVYPELRAAQSWPQAHPTGQPAS